MKQRKLKKFVVPGIYVLAICIFCTSIYLIQKAVNNTRFKSNENLQYVDSEIFNDVEYIPVINQQNTILRPYNGSDINIIGTFYNPEDDTATQEKSLIYYEGTYMQNTGTTYSSNNKFDIISILDGTVIEVSENELLGTTIKIKHSNDLISIYQSVSDVEIKENDNIVRGQVIAHSGISLIYNENNNLHIELIYNGKNINPEVNYNKTIDEL